MTLRQMRILKIGSTPNMADWTDKDGFIGRREVDGIDCGDGLQRTGMQIIGRLVGNPPPRNFCKVSFAEILRHRIGPSQYVRRPGPQLWRAYATEWMGRLNTTTGDQIRPIVVAMGLAGMHGQVWELAKALIKRGGFYWNTRDTGYDRQNTKKRPGWSGPEHWNIFFRAMAKPKGPISRLALKLLLLPGDFVGLLSTCYAVFHTAKKHPFNVDQLNRMITLLQGVIIVPTFFSRLSMKIFRKYRPTWNVKGNSSGTVRTPGARNDSLNPGLYVLETYFWHPTDPPFDFGPWRDICIKYFSRLK
jgi:hypothetical protein